jgi:hypothetical protein
MVNDRYLHVGAIILGISSALALYLNFQGVACLIALRDIGDQTISPQRIEEMERDCFIVTNSYVYSLFGAVAGIILIVIWFAKKEKKRSA